MVMALVVAAMDADDVWFKPQKTVEV